MRISLSHKVFAVFFPLTAMTLLLGGTIYFGMASLRASSDQIKLLKDFQIEVKELESRQAHISSQAESIDLKEVAAKIENVRKLAKQISAFDTFVPSDLREKLQKISFHIDTFHRAFRELHRKYLSDSDFLKTNFNLHFLMTERLQDAESAQEHVYQNQVAKLLILQTRIYHYREADQIPEMKKAYSLLEKLSADEKLLDMAREFVDNVEENFLNSLAIKNREKFLSHTAQFFFTLSNETIAAISKENLKNQRRLSQSIFVIILVTIFLAAFLWFLSFSYFKRFLTNQQKSIESIKNANYDYEEPQAADDEIGDLTITMKHLALSLKESRIQKRHSEEKYRELVENLADWIWEIDAQGHYIYSSPACKSILGFLPEEIIGQTPYDLVVTKQDMNGRALFIKILKGEKAFQELETRSNHKQGHQVIMETSGMPIYSESGDFQGFRGISRNITRRKESEVEKALLEEQLQQSQKMESIGRLAGGVAHDFNNILSAINGYAELLLLELKENDPMRERVEIILRSGQKAARLTQQLLAFSRKQIIKPEILDLNLEISETRKMISRILGEDIEISIFAAQDLWPVKTDRSQLEQIIINLVVNARDAMPQGGMLTIETANRTLDEDYVASHFSLSPGDYVALTITDTGCGINKEIQQNIFEPFFTTKEKDKGTGLGLATVYGIIKQNRGDIHLYSEIDKGTSFKIYLPRALKIDTRDDVSTPETTDALHQGTETILLVEDNVIVRELAVEILAKLGYTLLTAGNGPEALQLCTSYHGHIDLLLTDVVMPKMSGSELAKEIGKIWPDTKVLYMSGYTENSIVHHGVLQEGITFLHKPITPATLSLAVRRLLDS